MTPKHTPGPWFYDPEYSNDYYHSGHSVGTTHEGNDVCFYGIHNIADAALIAAAPELLQVLKDLEDWAKVPENLRGKPLEHSKAGGEIRKRIQSIIAKAEGRTND